MSRFPKALRIPCALLALSSAALPQGFAPGDLVKAKRGEELVFQGKEIGAAAKGAEFVVLKADNIRKSLFLEFYKDDGTLVAVTAPAEAFEPGKRESWFDLQQGVIAFRDQRYADAKRLLTQAAADPEQAQLANALVARINGASMSAAAARNAPAARPGFSTTLQALRDTAEQLEKTGQLALALWLDEGADRLAAYALGSVQAAPASKLDRAEVGRRVAISTKAMGRARQSAGLHRLVEASKYAEEGLQAEPERADLKALHARLQKDIEEADGHHKNASSMRNRGPKGTIHALTAVEMGLKLCADHPKLRELKNEMQGAFEERTAPQVTAAFLTAAGATGSKAILEAGRKIYTARCTECHDLELLDSRSMTAWRSVVASMARRAKIGDTEQAQIIEYITAAQRQLDSGS